MNRPAAEIPEATQQVGDRLLVTFVAMANNAEIQLRASITLTVGGLLVSGTLIGLSEYVERLGEQVLSSAAPDTHEGWRQLFDSWSETAREASEDTGTDPSFVHLADVQHFSPGQRPIPSGAPFPVWRGRLTEIDGWSMGALQSQD